MGATYTGPLLLVIPGKFGFSAGFHFTCFVCALRDPRMPWSNRALTFKCGAASLSVNALILFVFFSMSSQKGGGDHTCPLGVAVSNKITDGKPLGVAERPTSTNK